MTVYLVPTAFSSNEQEYLDKGLNIVIAEKSTLTQNIQVINSVRTHIGVEEKTYHYSKGEEIITINDVIQGRVEDVKSHYSIFEDKEPAINLQNQYFNKIEKELIRKATREIKAKVQQRKEELNITLNYSVEVV